LVNSRLGLVTAAARSFSPPAAPLLPKLRGQLAEFLDGGSLVHLGLLDLPTGVGLRYGQARTPQSAFLDGRRTPRWPAVHRPPLRRLAPRGDLDRVPAGSPCTPGTGLSTRCPSPTAVALGLGPANPRGIDLAAEPLGFRCGWLSQPIRYSCRHSPSSALHTPSRHGFAARTMLPYPCRIAPAGHGVGGGLEPRWIVGAAALSTSELLRTLSRMAASKPTSWLSLRRDLLAH
jgi:hypothetical protein